MFRKDCLTLYWNRSIQNFAYAHYLVFRDQIFLKLSGRSLTQKNLPTLPFVADSQSTQLYGTCQVKSLKIFALKIGSRVIVFLRSVPIYFIGTAMIRSEVILVKSFFKNFFSSRILILKRI
jgi:hypothetical protein